MIPLRLIVGFLAGAVVLSLAVEALRPRPEAPRRLYWDPAITIQYAVIDGLRIRHIKTGRGPNLVLLHTLRTQLDVFEKLIPRGVSRHLATRSAGSVAMLAPLP